MLGDTILQVDMRNDPFYMYIKVAHSKCMLWGQHACSNLCMLTWHVNMKMFCMLTCKCLHTYMSSIAMSTCLMLHVNIVVLAMLTYNTGVVNTSNMHVALRRHSDYYEESACCRP